jgi:glycosyltransferase involved in cell wall biosynthesis
MASRSPGSERLRVAFVAGTLARGGAEKQLIYMARALAGAGVQVRVYALTRGETGERTLQALGLHPVWIGQSRYPPARLLSLIAALRGFRPHIVQATHSYAGIYAGVAGRVYRAVSLGAIRNDGLFDVASNGRWGPWLLRAPSAIIANSDAARRNLQTLGVDAGRIHVVSNVIDLAEFDAQLRAPVPALDGPVVMAVARLVPEKRVDRFLEALASARRRLPGLRGVVIGEGPERGRLEQHAHELGLLQDGVRFLGRSTQVPALLQQAEALVLTSDREGLPNVILEAMAAGVPVVTTPAGDAGAVVQDLVSGFVTDFDDIDAIADHMVRIASSPELRSRLGAAGRERVRQLFSPHGFAGRLLDCYRVVGQRLGAASLLAALEAHPNARERGTTAA